jgi:hypothetical protein
MSRVLRIPSASGSLSSLADRRGFRLPSTLVKVLGCLVCCIASVVAALPINPAIASPTLSTTVTVTRYPRCSALNRRYPHGVGRIGVRDHTASAVLGSPGSGYPHCFVFPPETTEMSPDKSKYGRKHRTRRKRVQTEIAAGPRSLRVVRLAHPQRRSLVTHA